MTIVISDVHGKIDQYLNLIRDADSSYQIGDMGLGFKSYKHDGMKFVYKDITLPTLENHKFFRGNHDSPEVCNAHPNYMGDFGFDAEKSLFWIAGADSIDKHLRILGRDWWDNEELTHNQCWDMIALFEQSKPKYVISHDCPQVAMEILFPYRDTSRTRLAQQTCLDAHKPDLWLFGHHHQSVTCNHKGTEFRCLNELETFEIDFSL